MSNFIENTYAQALNAILDFVSGSENIGNQAIEQVIRSAFSVVETSNGWDNNTESKVPSIEELTWISIEAWDTQAKTIENQCNGIAQAIHAAMEEKK